MADIIQLSPGKDTAAQESMKESTNGLAKELEQKFSAMLSAIVETAVETAYCAGFDDGRDYLHDQYLKVIRYERNATAILNHASRMWDSDDIFDIIEQAIKNLVLDPTDQPKEPNQ